MKKVLLLSVAVCFGLAVIAQSALTPQKMSTEYKAKIAMEPVGTKSTAITSSVNDRQAFTKQVNGRDLTFVPMGGSGNAYGFYSDPRTYLWATPEINSVAFVHRMLADPDTYGNSRIAYDVSFDGGQSFTTNVQVYDPLGPDPGTGYPLAAARYPQGGIMNFQGNSDPANAYYTYFVCTLDNTNGNWGGFAWGANQLTAVDPPAPTQTNVTSGGDVWRLIPDAFTLTTDGHFFGVDGSYEGADYVYTGELIMEHGTFNTETNDWDVEETLIEAIGQGDGINDMKVAFAPDNMTGYICIMSDVVSDPQDFNGYHPILYKTTDGGETWDGPTHVLLGGYDGIEAIKYYWDDEVIEAIDEYAAGFDRDEVYYNMGFHCDMVVDENGNPHLTGLISIAVPDGWYPNEFFMATWHIWSEDGGETFDAYPVYNNRYFDGDLGGISEYNRPQISITDNGRYMFISCIDTDFEGIEENTQPDIYVCAYDPIEGTHTEMTNITEFTQAWLVAWMGSQSHFVFTEFDGTDVTCTVPFVYTELDPADPAAQVGFWYIDGWTYTFTVPVGYDEGTSIISNVSQNRPNPFNQTSVVDVEVAEATTLSIEVFNLMGQKVYDYDAGKVGAGMHQLTIDASNLKSGVYFYTVTAGENNVSRKMIVE